MLQSVNTMFEVTCVSFTLKIIDSGDTDDNFPFLFGGSRGSLPLFSTRGTTKDLMA